MRTLTSRSSWSDAARSEVSITVVTKLRAEASSPGGHGTTVAAVRPTTSTKSASDRLVSAAWNSSVPGAPSMVRSETIGR